MTVEDVAEATGMSRKAVLRVKNGSGWQHVT
jgi:DNA-binding LacI/PurR family transcriptional regulator